MTQAACAGARSEAPTRRFLSLGEWLCLLLLLFLVLPLCLLNLWGYVHARRTLTDEALRNASHAASLEASQIMLSLQHTEEVFVSALSEDRHLAELAVAVQEVDQDGRRQARVALRAVQAALRHRAPLEDLEILSPGGSVVLSTADEDGAAGHGAAPDCGPVPPDGTRILGVSPRGAAPRLLIASTLTADGGERVGTVCARFGFDLHRQLARGREAEAGQPTLYLLNERGEVVGTSVGEAASPEVQSFRGRGGMPSDLQHPWHGRYVLDSGVTALAAYAPIPPLGWGVVAEIPVSRALANLHRLERQAAAAAVVLGVLVLAAAVGSWRTVVYPLRALSRAAERLASGATGETVAPGGSREVVELARAFNRMSIALRDSQQTLEQRIAERTAELRESREFVELLLNSINHRVIVVDRAFRIVKANLAAVRTYGPGLVGRQCYALEGRTGPCEECAAARTFATGKAASEERSQQSGDAREAVEVETYPVFGPGGEVESVIEIGRIVSAEKQLQMQMMHQEKMAAFGLLAAGIAHDIGNPLAAIESQLQLARQQPHRQGETLAVVSNEVTRIARMLRELVDFARRRRDTITLVSVNQVVEDVTRLLRHDPRARTVDIVHRLGPKLPGVRTTEDHLFQVLFNLGLNSLDAMTDGGTLEFETSTRSGWVLVRTRDTGCGIPPAMRAQLFQPFCTTKVPERGTGLGLFVSKSIVESIGGDLTLEHTDQRGTVFAVFLPAETGTEGHVPA
jgi:C4-dicarboxylate-specific signal transduction histidine kinase